MAPSTKRSRSARSRGTPRPRAHRRRRQGLRQGRGIAGPLRRGERPGAAEGPSLPSVLRSSSSGMVFCSREELLGGSLDPWRDAPSPQSALPEPRPRPAGAPAGPSAPPARPAVPSAQPASRAARPTAPRAQPPRPLARRARPPTAPRRPAGWTRRTPDEARPAPRHAEPGLWRGRPALERGKPDPWQPLEARKLVPSDEAESSQARVSRSRRSDRGAGAHVATLAARGEDRDLVTRAVPSLARRVEGPPPGDPS